VHGMIDPLQVWFACEQLHIPKLFRSGKFRELHDEGLIGLGHVFEEAFDFGKLAEFVHASGAATDFAGSLCTTQQQHANDSRLSLVEPKLAFSQVEKLAGT